MLFALFIRVSPLMLPGREAGADEIPKTDQGAINMPSTKDRKDKQSETGSTQREDQTADDRRKERENSREGEGTPRDKSREQTAGTGRKME